MFTTKKFLKLLTCTNDELDQKISELSEDDAKHFVKITIRFFQEQCIMGNELDKFS